MDSKLFLVNALSCLNQHPIPSKRDLAAALLWIARTMLEISRMDPNEEARQIAEDTMRDVIAGKYDAEKRKP